MQADISTIMMLALFALVVWALVRLFVEVPFMQRVREGFESVGITAKGSADGAARIKPSSKKRAARTAPTARQSNRDRFTDMIDGFYGGAVRGTGHPDCLRTLDSAAKVLAAFDAKVVASVGDGPADREELALILSKMACLKKDLMSPSGIVDATRYQPFETAHDREPVAEVCATCLNNTIAPRDLDIIFATWKDRGNLLIRRLCTAADMDKSEMKAVEKDFKTAWEDVYSVAKGRCLQTVDEGKGVALVGGLPPVNSLSGRPYKNGAGSGWNGAV